MKKTYNHLLSTEFLPIATPYGPLELEDLAAMMETTVDYLLMEFLI